GESDGFSGRGPYNSIAGGRILPRGDRGARGSDVAGFPGCASSRFNISREVRMRKVASLAVLMLAMVILFSGCATRDWVRDLLGKKEVEIGSGWKRCRVGWMSRACR